MRLDDLFSEEAIPKQVYTSVKDVLATNSKGNEANFSDTYGYEKIITSKLRKLGWKKIGEGYYSYVYANPNNKFVLKVNMRGDREYDRYVQMIRSKKNKYYPLISDRKKLMTIGKETFYAYLIEKLYPYAWKDPDRKALASLSTALKQFGIGVENNKDMEQDYKRWIKYNADFYNKYPKLIETIYKLAKANPRSFDLHSQNMMHRADGTPVISDPYAS